MDYIPEIALILVNWNGYAFTRACLLSLEEVPSPKFHVILVDNGSSKREGQKLKEEFSHLHLIETEENLGFAGGNNVGLRYALKQGYSYVVLLNNDTLVSPNFLEEMHACMVQQPGCGVVQPLILFLHDPKKIWSAGGSWNALLGKAKTLGDRDEVATYNFPSSSLDWATGCCMLVSKEAITQAGLLDEQYFAYFEDVEWSLRIRKAGFSLALAKQALIYHEAGAASKKQHPEGTLQAPVFYYHVRNQFFLLRQLGLYQAIPYHLLRFVAWGTYFLFRGRRKKLTAVSKGILHGLSQRLTPQIK
ncbi:MAG: glycosyltransferase family 2 protein [Algoriphagus sp.]